jgi:YidC/Oxa1 family membrane protein insertase
MALYARHGISPFSGLAGCFPMLLQMPVFIGLFVVLGRAVELRDAPFVGWITNLAASDVVLPGISIPWVMPAGIAVLPFIMVLTTWLQTKQTITDPNQKMMVWMMPIMMFVFSSVMPSGLVLYWIVSNLWSIAQFALMNRGHLTPNAVAGDKAGVVDAKIVKFKK